VTQCDQIGQFNAIWASCESRQLLFGVKIRIFRVTDCYVGPNLVSKIKVLKWPEPFAPAWPFLQKLET